MRAVKTFLYFITILFLANIYVFPYNAVEHTKPPDFITNDVVLINKFSLLIIITIFDNEC